ncbi:MAG: hypothetical protein HY017_01155 [Betaproteobacteria bacterium]|nr:hypothetical protein [Betaproteobacteria bacterium]
MERQAILLAEHAEAGQNCRAQEQYVRATLSMYLVLSSALVVLLTAASASPQGRVWLSSTGAAVGLCMYLLVRRHQSLYAAYVKCAKTIEAELQLSLYTQVGAEVSGAGSASAKSLSALIVAILGVAFGIAALYFASGAK